MSARDPLIPLDPPDPSDAELARAAQAGDHASFDALSGRHRPRLIRWMTSLVWDADEAESLAQEALTRAWSGLPAFHCEQPFSPWLNGIGLNVCRQHLRKRARREDLVDPAALQEQAPAAAVRGPLSSLVSREQAQFAQQAIAELPIALREAFVLREIEDWDYPQIAEATGVAEGTLRVRVSRARALLRDRLGSLVDTWLLEGRAGGK